MNCLVVDGYLCHLSVNTPKLVIIVSLDHRHRRCLHHHHYLHYHLPSPSPETPQLKTHPKRVKHPHQPSSLPLPTRETPTPHSPYSPPLLHKRPQTLSHRKRRAKTQIHVHGLEISLRNPHPDLSLVLRNLPAKPTTEALALGIPLHPLRIQPRNDTPPAGQLCQRPDGGEPDLPRGVDPDAGVVRGLRYRGRKKRFAPYEGGGPVMSGE
ncbi:hypothetical protein M501DRAFT_1014475 [Patellaria atrata CBS 101060]|uniref:Uncharacterized protein n=1 Tax=Patellaria atrata CBS 101060 TaxID=1346257 RepID=A0A9P4SH28_9PEZI|nr:hypothetical protein M501DRAFT_1014475 [Patellaria atrata CBS 101060]